MPKRAQVLNEADQVRVLTLVRATSRYPARDVAMLALSHFAGLRVGEIAGLDVEDVLDASSRIRDVVTLVRTKGKRKREMFLAAPAVKNALKAHLDEIEQSKRSVRREGTKHHPLFVTKNLKPFTSVTACQLFSRFYKEWAKIEGASGHSGRRGFITSLAERGYNLSHIAALAGHASVSTTAVYVQSNPHLLRQMASSVVGAKIARTISRTAE